MSEPWERLEVWIVEFDDGDRCVFADKGDARNELWTYYMDNYFEQDSPAMRGAARKEFDEENFIDGIGWINHYTVH